MVGGFTPVSMGEAALMGLHPWLWTAVLPWAMAVVWLMRGRGDVVAVPWVALWPRGGGINRRREWRRPPWAVVGALVGSLVAIGGAVGGGPIGRLGITQPGAAVIVDRNPAATAMTLGPDVGADIPRPVRLVAGGDRVVDDWRAVANGLPPSNERSRALAAAIAETPGTVYVVTHRPIMCDDPRVIRIDPGGTDTLMIRRLAVRDGPNPQAMIELNPTGRERGTTIVRVDGIDTPIGGVGFVDLPKLTDRVTAAVGGSTRTAVAVAAVAPLVVDPSAGGAVARLARAYQKHRPAGTGGGVVVSDRLMPGGVTVVPAATTRPAGAIHVADHPITRDVVDWPACGDGSMPAGFRPVVTEGDRVAVAIGPGRAVWIDLRLDDWSESADFVVFFTNVFDHATGGDATYTDQPASTGNLDWSAATEPIRVGGRAAVADRRSSLTTPAAWVALSLCLLAAFGRSRISKPARSN